MKAFVREFNRQANLQTMMLIVLANVVLFGLWCTELYVPQSDISKLDRSVIKENMLQIINFKSEVCLDTSRLQDDVQVKSALEGYFKNENFKKCNDCDACFEFNESNVSRPNG